jgi:prepilin-type N-terminal cleavage/methylation domain-containing protein/prepilin-type processing-associated H-X9-DG protein
MKKGFTLIELLVVIAIIAILAAILFPVFARAREKARQTTCTSNQRQIAASLQMYAQDHGEMLPSTGTVWIDLQIEPSVLNCATAGKTPPNSYIYNGSLNLARLGLMADPTKKYVTADGTSSTVGGVLPNIGTSPTQLSFRHSSKVVISFLDGHCDIIDQATANKMFPTTDYAYWIFSGAVPTWPAQPTGKSWTTGTPTIDCTGTTNNSWYGAVGTFTDPTGVAHPYSGNPPFYWWKDSGNNQPFVITFNATNMTNIKVEYGVNSASPAFIDTVEYTTGSIATKIIGAAVNPSPNTWADKRVVNDFSALTAINNKPFVSIKWKNNAGSAMSMTLNGVMISGTYTP